jgi:hypothetical protein
LLAHFVFVAVEQVVVSEGEIKQTPRCDALSSTRDAIAPRCCRSSAQQEGQSTA